MELFSVFSFFYVLVAGLPGPWRALGITDQMVAQVIQLLIDR